MSNKKQCLRGGFESAIAAIILAAASIAQGQYIPVLTRSRLPPTETDNPWSMAAALLGQQLFFDKNLSADGTVSCATCHIPARAWTDGRPRGMGILLASVRQHLTADQGRAFASEEPEQRDARLRNLGHRNTPTIVGTCFERLLFHDGRAESLAAQAAEPIQDRGEMGLTEAEAVSAISSVPAYVDQFEEVFGGPVTMDRIAAAIASFERTIQVQLDTVPFLRYLDGDLDALADSGVRGALLFVGSRGAAQADVLGKYAAAEVQQYVLRNFTAHRGCAQCHNGPDLRNGEFVRSGVGAGGVDQGRATINDDQRDVKKFKVAGLLIVGRTAPYGHDGSVPTLAEMVRRYNLGMGSFDGRSDARVRAPLGMTASEAATLASFLEVALDGKFPILEAP